MKPCVRGGAPQQADVTGSQENVTWAWGGICYIIDIIVFLYIFIRFLLFIVCLLILSWVFFFHIRFCGREDIDDVDDGKTMWSRW